MTTPLLAVLAFDNLSGEKALAYFSDGVSDEIQQTLSSGADLKVIGRGSSFQFRGADKAAANVAAHLNATHVLDGSVRRSGERVRISAELIECASEVTLWSDRFDRDLTDIFALQDEIAAAVAEALRLTIARAAEPGPIDPAVYDLYLRARDLMLTAGMDAERQGRVLAMLEEVTGGARGFARAWSALAVARARALRQDQPPKGVIVTRELVAQAAQTALAIDPSRGAAHQALSQLEPYGRYLERQALHQKALAAAPNDPEVLTFWGQLLAEVGRMAEAAECAKQALALDPLFPPAANWYAATLNAVGRYDESRLLWDDYLARWPQADFITINSIGGAGATRHWDRFEALVQAAEARHIDSGPYQDTVLFYRNLRRPDPAYVEGLLRTCERWLAKVGGVPLHLPICLHALGREDQAFGVIDRSSFAYMFEPDGRAPTAASGLNPAVLFSYLNRPMTRDARFIGFCAKLGLCDYWARSEHWPDCADQVDYDFRAEARQAAKPKP